MNTQTFQPDQTAALQAAIRLFDREPGLDSILLLNAAASVALTARREEDAKEEAQPEPVWYAPSENPGDWYHVRVTFDRWLSDALILSASGCLGYALRQTLNGEPLSLPRIVSRSRSETVVEYSYDSTKSQRDDDHTDEAFTLAQEYIVSGSPVRTTDLAGRGTKGTPLARGIGPVGVRFQVR